MPIVTIKQGRRNTTKFSLPDLWDTLNEIKKKYPDREIHVAIEQLGPQPVFGAIPNFVLGNNYGHLEMALVAAELSFEYVLPSRWKKDMGIPTNSDKTASRMLAQKLFPKHRELFKRVRDDGRADATIMAEWLKRQLRG